MYQNHSILAYIPARGGSKGIPGKNIIDLCGKPLIAYSIEVALSCPYIDYVHVSTDSPEIAQIARNYGAMVEFLRPSECATDTSKTIDAMCYDIQRLSKLGHSFDSVALLQPTQPIRTSDMLGQAIESLYQSTSDSLVSVCSVTEHPILMRTISEDGHLQPLLNLNSTVRRQDFPSVYKVNGSIYINRINKNFNDKTSLNDNILPFIMDTQYSVDIDTYEDLEKASNLINSLKTNNNTGIK